jgi:hypothetical protein
MMNDQEHQTLELLAGERQSRADGLRPALAKAREDLDQARRMPDGPGKAEMIEHAQSDIRAIEDHIAACLRAVEQLNARIKEG